MMRGSIWRRQTPPSACALCRQPLSCAREGIYVRRYSNASSPFHEKHLPSESSNQARSDNSAPLHPRRAQPNVPYAWGRTWAANSSSSPQSPSKPGGRSVGGASVHSPASPAAADHQPYRTRPSHIRPPASRPENSSLPHGTRIPRPHRAAEAPPSREPNERGRKEWGQLARRPRPAVPREPGQFVPLSRVHPGPMRKPARDILGPSGNAGARSRTPRKGDFWAQLRDKAVDQITPQDASSEYGGNWAWADNLGRERARSSPTSDARRGGVTSHARLPTDARDRYEKPKKKVKIRRRGREDEEEDDDDYDEDVIEERRRQKAERKAQRGRGKGGAVENAGPTPILLPEFISVSNLAVALGVKSGPFLRQLEELGFETIANDSIMTGDTAALVAQEYGFEPTVEIGEHVDLKPRPLPDDMSSLPPRPPVVTIMGHVDHGKTTLLDWLRKSSVAAQEHGGITQHIGAFSVTLSSGKQITFLDTPGHAAFLTMRQRGANVTDIVVLVVAADDSVKPQTLEALKHARAAKVPIIVAINKIDKDEARIDHVKADLARHGIEIEDYGGDVQVVCVSGKTGQGMGDLEENILTLSEILDLRAETGGMAEGWVLEASTKTSGKAATILVRRGTLRRGDFILAGVTWAKIRVLRNEVGVEVDEAPPGTAVEILGWKDAPQAGDQVLQAPSEDKAKSAAEYRKGFKERERAIAEMERQERRERDKLEAAKVDSPGGAGAEAGVESATRIVNFTVKGDVVGSVEAVCAAVMEMGNNEVRPSILRSAAGQISEFDVEHAATSGSRIINFNNPIPAHIRAMAEGSGVRILDHTVIYHLADDVKEVLSEYLAPVISSRVLGEAEVLQIFPINVKRRVYKNIAGCRVRNGQVSRSAKYRLVRNGEKIFEGNAESLMHGKKDVSEMRKGTECGISLVNWDDFREGDLLQAYEEVIERRHL